MSALAGARRFSSILARAFPLGRGVLAAGASRSSRESGDCRRRFLTDASAGFESLSHGNLRGMMMARREKAEEEASAHDAPGGDT